jgi:pilus assembly protein Flp/PilA
MSRSLVQFLKREDGPTAVEFAVLVSVTMLICLTAISVLGSHSHKAPARTGQSVRGTGS